MLPQHKTSYSNRNHVTQTQCVLNSYICIYVSRDQCHEAGLSLTNVACVLYCAVMVSTYHYHTRYHAQYTREYYQIILELSTREFQLINIALLGWTIAQSICE